MLNISGFNPTVWPFFINICIIDYLPGFLLCYTVSKPVVVGISVNFMSELIKLRNNYLMFSGDFYFSLSAIVTVISYVSTAL